MNGKFISLVLGVVVIAGLLVFQATRTTTTSILLPSDLIRKGSEATLTRIQIGGRIADKPIEYQLEPKLELRFEVEDPKGPIGTVPVVYHGAKPDMFEKGRDVIVEGEYKQGVFYAARLLTQCPSKYDPPSPSGSPNQLQGNVRP